MTKWVTKKLGEICEKITDGSHDSPKPVDDGYYMPSVKDMRHDNFDFSDCKQISKNDFERLKGTGCKPEIGDVLIAKDGSILKYCFVVEQDLPIVILSSIAILRPDKSIIDGKFLSYYFQKEDVVTDVVENYKSGTGVPRIVLRNFEQIEIPYPESLAEQRRIAGILSSADGAIAASEALIEKYRNIKRGLLTTLLQPKEGWKKVKLGECCEPSSEKYNPLIQTEFKDCIEMENMEQGSGTINGTSDISKLLSIKNTFRKRDVLYGKLRPYLRKYWLAQFDGVCSTEIWVLRHSEFIDAQFLFYLFQTELINKIANLSSGTKMPRADWSLMQNQELFIPDLAEQRRIAEILSSVDAKIAAEEKVVEKYKGVKKGLMEEMMKEIKVNN